ncbi:MAG TPA: BolA family transcriptional regulator [Acidiferrobacteraceae bacterium]|nr:BolA family transcriptional regulator [Acidiferrobacteraceae bacterium]
MDRLDRCEKIEQKLVADFSPQSIEVIDQSHHHVGHAGAQSGGGHFDVNIVAKSFKGRNQVARHRMIYAALSDMIPAEIHALSIKAHTPDEL